MSPIGWACGALAIVAVACSANPEAGRGNHGSSGAPSGDGFAGGASSGGASGGSAAGSGGGGPSTSYPCTGDQATFDALVAEVTAALKAKGVPGGAVSVVACGDRIYSAGIGLASIAENRPVTPHTRFQIASTTKLLTAALAVRLAERGTISLDDPVSKWVPFINTSSPYATGFTIAELLAHTSGYPAGLDTANYSNIELSFQQNAGVQLWSPPGEVFNYSNDGYTLAGLALQKATGQAFAPLLEAELFGPAGMLDASMDGKRVQDEGNYAVGYGAYDGSANLPTGSYYSMPYYGPMGGAWASVEDMAQLSRALIAGGGALFTPASLDEMTRVRTRTTWGSTRFGLGVMIDELDGGTSVWGHSGSVGGFLSSFDVIPSRGFAIAVVVNSDAHIPWLLDSAAHAFTGTPLTGGEPSSFRAEDMADHVGTYQSLALGTVVVQSSGGGLQLTIGGKTSALEPAWLDTYFFDYAAGGGESDAHFWRVSGSVKYLVTPWGVGVRQ
jgi:CubicO group peptidase (beta-lactamase class C family)